MSGFTIFHDGTEQNRRMNAHLVIVDEKEIPISDKHFTKNKS